MVKVIFDINRAVTFDSIGNVHMFTGVLETGDDALVDGRLDNFD